MDMTRMPSIFREKYAMKLHVRYLSQRRSQHYTISMLFQHIIGLVFIVIIVMSADVYAAAASSFEPDFVFPLENVTVAQGRDATFTCVVNNLGGYRVSGDGAQARVAWIKADAKAILAIHEHVITNSDRLSVTHNDFNTWTLVIRNVRMEDRGQYMCQVNTDPMKMQTAFLEVVIPPDIVYEETSGDMMVPEGSSAKLVCKARGFPKPKITWRREDGREIIARNGPHGKSKALSVEGEMLWLTKITRSEMGIYLCIASNQVPPSVSKRMKLQIHFHPLIQVPNMLVGAPLGVDITLVCNVEASPKAINYWQKENGEMIIPNDRYVMHETESSMYAIQMTLTIKHLQKPDFGGYRCISKNSIGGIEATIRLYEMELTKKTKHQRLNIDDDGNNLPNDDSNEDGIINKNGRLYKVQHGENDDEDINDVNSSASTLNIHQRQEHRTMMAKSTPNSILLSSIILLFALDFLLLPVLSIYKQRMIRRLFRRFSLL